MSLQAESVVNRIWGFTGLTDVVGIRESEIRVARFELEYLGYRRTGHHYR